MLYKLPRPRPWPLRGAGCAAVAEPLADIPTRAPEDPVGPFRPNSLVRPVAHSQTHLSILDYPEPPPSRHYNIIVAIIYPGGASRRSRRAGT